MSCCSDTISSSARVHWAWIQSLGIRLAFPRQGNTCAGLLTARTGAPLRRSCTTACAAACCCARCTKPVPSIIFSFKTGVMLCFWQIVNKLERREFVAGIEQRPKARAQYIHNCKRWVRVAVERWCDAVAAIVPTSATSSSLCCWPCCDIVFAAAAVVVIMNKNRRALEALRQNKKVPVWRLWSEEVCLPARAFSSSCMKHDDPPPVRRRAPVFFHLTSRAL